MSNNTIINLDKFEVEDFISIEHGTEKIILTFFKGKIQVGMPGWANQVELAPEKAEQLGRELIERAKKIYKARQHRGDSES